VVWSEAGYGCTSRKKQRRAALLRLASKTWPAWVTGAVLLVQPDPEMLRGLVHKRGLRAQIANEVPAMIRIQDRMFEPIFSNELTKTWCGCLSRTGKTLHSLPAGNSPAG